MKLHVGTSGFSYAEWKGTFYPEKIKSAEMLPFYAGRFQTVEINNTFYRMPRAELVTGWAAQVAPEFRFVLKAPKRITHDRRLLDVADPLEYFLNVAMTLGERRGPLLFQLPPNFKQDLPRLEAFLALLPATARAAFEFRHPSWFEDPVLAALENHGVALCIADTEDGVDAPFAATAKFGYLRLRDVDYPDPALHGFIERIRAQAWEEAFVFFKHEDEARGPAFAERFIELSRGVKSGAWAALLLLACPAVARAAARASGDTLGVRVATYLARAEAFGFSGAVVIEKDGAVVLDRAYGLARRSHRVPNTPETLTLIGSLSKQFTATAILALEQAGRLSVGDSIGRFFDDVPADKRAITLRQLLTHTSGLPGGYPDMSDHPAPTLAEGVRRTLATPLDTIPGARFEYSNVGYLLLAAAVEKASGEPYDRYLRERLFAPAGLARTCFIDEPERWKKLPVAHGFNREVDWGLPGSRPVRRATFGFGGALSNVEELRRWHQALATGRVLPESLAAQLFVPRAEREAGVSYGYGWEIERTPHGLVIGHGGDASPEGWTCDWRWFEESRVLVLVTSNTMRDTWGASHPVMDALRAIVTGAAPVMPPDSLYRTAPDVPALAGRYRLASGGSFEVRRILDGLEIGAEGEDAAALLIPPKDAAERESRAQWTARTLRVVEAASRSDWTPLATLLDTLGIHLSAAEARARYGEHWVRWDTLFARYGPLRSVEPLGTVPSYDDPAVAHVRLNFARGAGVLRWLWWSHGLDRVYFDRTLPGAVPLRPQQGGGFVGWDLYVGRGAAVRFDREVGSKPRGLTIGVVTATRETARDDPHH